MKPTGIVLDCHTETGNFRAYAKAVLRSIERQGLPPVQRWQSYDVDLGDPKDRESALSAFPESASGFKGTNIVIGFMLSESLRGSIMFDPEEEGGPTCSTHLSRKASKNDSEADLARFETQCIGLCEDLLAEVGLYSADLHADGVGGDCLPRVPMVSARTRIAVTNHEQVERNYDDPDAFWSADWTKAAEHHGQQLLVRGGKAGFGPPFLKSIIDDHWSMARAARPTRTRYAKPSIIPEEKEVFCDGEKRLHFVGYAPDEKLIEYSCALNPGEHIHGWEIYGLLDILTEKKTRDGSPVNMVRIVFLEEWMAKQEKRPLLDIGCRVFHYDDDGELRELKN